jgi:hypothetical protein
MRSLLSYIIQAQESEDIMRRLVDRLNATGKLKCDAPPDSFYWTGTETELRAILDEHQRSICPSETTE